MLREIRDAASRAALDSLRLVVQADAAQPEAEGGAAESGPLGRASSPLCRQPPLPHGMRAGFYVEDAPPAMVRQVREAARATGDLASLSAADVDILALALQYHASATGHAGREGPQQRKGSKLTEAGPRDGGGKGGQGSAPAPSSGPPKPVRLQASAGAAQPASALPLQLKSSPMASVGESGLSGAPEVDRSAQGDRDPAAKRPALALAAAKPQAGGWASMARRTAKAMSQPQAAPLRAGTGEISASEAQS